MAKKSQIIDSQRIKNVFLELKKQKKVKNKGDFAEKLAISANYLSLIFHNKAKITESFAFSFQKFNINPNYLLGESDEMFLKNNDFEKENAVIQQLKEELLQIYRELTIANNKIIELQQTIIDKSLK